MGRLAKRLALKPDAVEEAHQVHGRLKSVHEFLQDALDGAGGAANVRTVVDALKEAAPWASSLVSALGEALPPVKFVLKLFEGLIEVHDPNELGFLACTLAYQQAIQQAVPEVLGMAQPNSRIVRKQLVAESTSSYDFAQFSWDQALTHPFVRDAAWSVAEFARAVELDDTWSVRLQREVHARFVPNLKVLLSHGDTHERFAPFRRLVELPGTEATLRGALLEHADTQRWTFEERGVLGSEPFSLAQVYVEPRCTSVDWADIHRAWQPVDPFNPNLETRALLESVIDAFGKRSDTVLIVQGPAGSGKSTFTLHLCCHLLQVGMTPLRIQLKHLDTRPGVHLADALARALECNDPARKEGPAFLPQGVDYARAFLALFEEKVVFRGIDFCPYVLILDGWDELPLSANYNYLERLRGLLRDLNELFVARRSQGAAIRVLLCGRPSDFLVQTRMLSASTRVLSIHPWRPEDFELFVERVGAAQARATHSARAGRRLNWRLPPKATLQHVAARFREDAQHGVLDVLGSPLIAHLCLRLLGEEAALRGSAAASGDELLTDRTSLYRRLVDLVIKKAGKAPSADYEPEKGAMIAGADLRELLHKTAEVMTVLGTENVSRDELTLRLDLDHANIEERLRRLEGDELVSRLMISFFFKGGYDAHGCEFSHKSFREYLFAEHLIEVLKQCGADVRWRAQLRRLPEDYFRDFEEEDPRHRLSRRLAEAVGPQWLSREVKSYVRDLLLWEIGRSRVGSEPEVPSTGQATRPAPREAWVLIRDGLADLWDWWAEGVHLRPQAHRRPKSREYDWEPGLAHEVARGARFRALHDVRSPSIPTFTIDAHLGDALFELAACVHAALLGEQPERTETEEGQATFRRSQKVSSEGIRFAPSRSDSEFLALYTHRMNAAGYRPAGPFPAQARLSGVDLEGVDLIGANLRGANLHGARLQSANLRDANLIGANLRDANLIGANLQDAKLQIAHLGGANVQRANLQSAFLNQAILDRASLRDANLQGAILKVANLQGTNLIGANLQNADLRGANLQNAELRAANLGGAVLGGANLQRAALHRAVLSGANLVGADLLEANLEGASYDAATQFPEGFDPTAHGMRNADQQ